MSDLFSQQNYIWTLPLAAFTLIIVLATCYFLRREIGSFFKNLFFPDTQRYTVPASVISNVDTDGQQASLNKDKVDTNLQKKPRTILRNMETNTRWGFRKLKHKITDGFAEIAGTEDAPSKKGTGIITREETAPAAIPQNAILQTTQEHNPKKPQNQDKPASFIPEDIEEEYPETPSEINTVIIKEDNLSKEQEDLPPAQKDIKPLPMPAAVIEDNTKENTADKQEQIYDDKTQEQTLIKQEDKKTQEPALAAVAAEQTPKNEQAVKQEIAVKKTPFLSDRTALIIGLLILACFTIFLTAKVRLLSSLAIRNHILIKDLQTQIQIMRYEQNGVQVIIHERTSAPEKKI